MTSPVDTSVKWMRNTMPGAPVLTRAAGSLIGLLDAFLVNGWGQQTASSMVVLDGIATANFPTDHAAARHAVVLVDGVTGAMAALNGEQKVTSVEPNKIKWATALPNGTATGTITVKMAPAGWGKPFSGANLAVYKSLAPEAHGQFLRVNDAGAQTARVVGYETMTGISTGTGLFPSAAQVSGGYYWGKNNAASGTTPIDYLLASDGRFLYFLPRNAAEMYGSSSCAVYWFGDMVPLSPGGDPFATVLAGAPDPGFEGYGGTYFIDYGATDGPQAAPRPVSGVGTSSRGATTAESRQVSFSSTEILSTVTGQVSLSRVVYRDRTDAWPRALLPGLWVANGRYAERAFQNYGVIDTVDGSSLVGFHYGDQVYANAGTLLGAIDVKGPWR